MVPKAGEVYHDDVFDWEVTIVDVNEDHVVLDDPVGGEDVRNYRLSDWKHNMSVNRFSKIGEQEVVQSKELSEKQTEGNKGIFDY